MAAALTFKVRVGSSGHSGRGCCGISSRNELSSRGAGRVEARPGRAVVQVVASGRAKAQPQVRVGPPEIARVDIVSFDGTPVGQEEVEMRTAGPNSEHVVHRKLIQVRRFG